MQVDSKRFSAGFTSLELMIITALFVSIFVILHLFGIISINLKILGISQQTHSCLINS